ncbi:uncharacterized protein MONOS_18088 [Monocercomonoides exilis]|uniref:uncharacterized protein n=1 Tax=Monocercomonoides exilis TaxID=2049356 RepID=UPI0035596507|nr:hypothetical protein MONOS_18088 [Monocercomonoides exilis]
MIVDEEQKKEEKSKKLFADLCECYLLLNGTFSSELFSICIFCLLKVALKKEENEETQKGVEMALLALSKIIAWNEMGQELFLNAIKEIMKYHQKHHNLTRLAYQSAWQFLINRLSYEKSLEGVIVNELHFVREARKELEELAKSVDWKRKAEENERRGKERKEEFVLLRLLQTCGSYFLYCNLWNEEFAGLIDDIVQALKVSKDNYRETFKECIYSLKAAADNRAVKIDFLVKGGAVDAILEEIQQQTMDDKLTLECTRFFESISSRLKE